MQLRPLIALCIAIIAAVLIIFAGKSCAEDIAKSNRKTPHLITDPTLPFNTADLTPPNYKPTKEGETTEAEETTDFFSTIPTDEYGMFIETTAPTEAGQMYMIVTNADGQIVEMIPVTTSEEEDAPATTLDFLDEYEAEQASREAAEQARREAETTTYDPNQKIEIPFIEY
ncbi:hypothetical protein [uncultured Ruminococcus sp.]|uniref:hypothetical protein n=1 Tax=uncultured Ruminococcus sp. TaxID=165186 RepID=UPI0025D72327|nr:hypothetical protein [uncultured Ruminococcus sp.]